MGQICAGDSWRIEQLNMRPHVARTPRPWWSPWHQSYSSTRLHWVFIFIIMQFLRSSSSFLFESIKSFSFSCSGRSSGWKFAYQLKEDVKHSIKTSEQASAFMFNKNFAFMFNKNFSISHKKKFGYHTVMEINGNNLDCGKWNLETWLVGNNHEVQTQ